MKKRQIRKSELEVWRDLRDQYIRGPGESAVPGERISKREARRRRDLAKKESDRKKSAEIARARAQSRYYQKNKARLNKKRVLRNRDPHYAFTKARNKAKAKGISWSLTFEEYLGVWESTRPVLDTDSMFYVTAWSKRGSDPSRHAQMVRIDTTEGWHIGNVEIHYRGENISEYGT